MISIGNIVGSALSNLPVVGGFFSGVESRMYQEDQRNYERAMQKQAWQREDSAAQRRVADLRAAGLSPTLAAGSAASAASPVQTTPREAPHDELSLNDIAGLAATIQGIKGQQLDNSLKEAQIEAFEDLFLNPKRSQVDLNSKQIDILAHNFKYAEEHGLPVGKQAMTGEYAIDVLQKTFENWENLSSAEIFFNFLRAFVGIKQGVGSKGGKSKVDVKNQKVNIKNQKDIKFDHSKNIYTQ